MILLISASQVAGITGVSHWHPAGTLILVDIPLVAGRSDILFGGPGHWDLRGYLELKWGQPNCLLQDAAHRELWVLLRLVQGRLGHDLFLLSFITTVISTVLSSSLLSLSGPY
jgi:hypothetical protein